MRWLTRLLPSCFCCSPAPRPFRPPRPSRPASASCRSPSTTSPIASSDLDGDAVTTRTLAQFFDWLKGTGWTAVSLDDIAAAARGTRPLPDKAILITFDDGYRSLYTRVFPLLQVYRFPIVAALVGSWMEGRPDGTVPYGDRSRAAQPLHLVGRGARDAGVGPGRVRLAQLRPAPRRAGQPAGQHDPVGVHLALRSGDRDATRPTRSSAPASAPTCSARASRSPPISAGRRAPSSGRTAAIRSRAARRSQGARLHLRGHARARALLHVRPVRHQPLLSLAKRHA